ncbi:MAG: deoxynucleoside kinase [Oscillospiraceae bacterium]|nr:deoxynucleoside kinase [Oscillospiraceae bacterium]
MGKLIVIEGLDGSGKATQANMLFEKLHRNNPKVKKVTFPDYESRSSEPIKMYLAGEISKKADGVNAFAASSFYAVDRYISFKKGWEDFYNEGGIVIADRYTTSNGVHQCSKLPREKWEGFMNWLSDFEYSKIGIPKPDAVIYLDMSPEVSQKLMSKRYLGDESKKDIHEKDKEYLAKSREAAYFCIIHDKWIRIQCDDGENPLTIEEISDKIFEVVKKVL